MKYFKILFLLVIILSTLHINAKLRRSKLSKLIFESELIVKGKVIQSSLNKDEYSGSAKIKVEEVIKGNIDKTLITILWNSEVHDQRLRTVGEQRIFFLKLTEAKYTGTHYGRSYIPLKYHQSVANVGYFIEYKYPTDVVDIDFPHLLKGNEMLNINSDMQYTSVYSDSLILLNDLIEIIKRENEL